MGDSMGGLALSLILVLGGLGMVAGALLGVPIWGYWHHTAATNLQALGRAGHHTPAAHVYWWFVPFANLWMPYRTTKELVVHSHPDNEGLPIGGFDPALDDAEEATAPLVGTLPLWWGLHLVSNILTNAAGRMDRTSQRGSDLSFVNDSMTTLSALAVGVDLAGTLLGLGAVVLYLRIVRQVTADQEELASSMDTAPTGYAG
jgi:hypothetical protein